MIRNVSHRRGINAQPLLPGFCGSWEAYSDVDVEEDATSTALKSQIVVGIFSLLMIAVAATVNLI